jgi:peptidoglycan/xylan/chitin deacetylase (PgdA/CDA1 family)
MQQGGMHFGSHGWTHRSLGRLRPGEALAEAAHSRRLLERRTGERVRHFAYPFGSRVYGDCDATARAAVSAAGYQSACTTAVGRVGPGADPLLLPRIPIDPGDGPFLVRAKLAGAFDWMGPAKRLWQRLVPRREQVDWPPARDAFAGSRPLPSVGE